MPIQEIDWNAIQEVCGYTDEEIAALQRSQAFRLPEDPGELMKMVHAGVVYERKMRLAATDAPGGLTETLKNE